MLDERACWLAWSRVKRVGPILIKRLYEYYGELAIAWQASVASLQQVEGIGPKLAQMIAAQRSQLRPEALLAQQTDNFLTPAEAGYPPLLFEICDPPPLLYYRGRLELLQRINEGMPVAIVGTRKPTDYGRRWTQTIARHLAQHSSVIISGLAEGIDREAHYSALTAQGETIAVLGTGVDQLYPLSNRALYERIEQAGLLLSEYPNGTPPDRSHFPQRNRIIAGLSRVVIVTEAPLRSGALITAQLANDYGREVYALPGSLDNPQILGCLNLIGQGAQMIMGTDSLTGAMAALPTSERSSAPKGSLPMPNLPPLLDQVYQALSQEPRQLDRLGEQLGIATGQLLSALTQLEIRELVVQLPGAHYRRRD